MQQSLTIDLPSLIDPAPSFARVLTPLLALALAMAIGFTMMGSFATLQEGAKAEMGLSDATLGLVIGFGAAVPLVLFSIPIGILVDRTNRVRLMIALAVVWTAGTLLTALADNVPLLFAARMLTGIGTTGALTAALSLGADMCAPAQRGRALLVVTLGKTLGTAAGFALAGWLLGTLTAGGANGWFGDAAAWRGAHFALAILSAVLIVPLLFLREPQRREVAAGPHAPFRVVGRELWGRRAFLIPLFIGQAAW